MLPTPPPPPKKYDEQSHVHLQGSVHYLLHTPCYPPLPPQRERPHEPCDVQLQGVVQQQCVVRAVQLECRSMQHECSRQAAAIQLLESAADRRRMQERQQEHHFWDVAREVLGKLTHNSSLKSPLIVADKFASDVLVVAKMVAVVSWHGHAQQLC